MGKSKGPWQDGRNAWERLNGWYEDDPSAKPSHPDDGNDALRALADIGLIRRLLDQAELTAVRTGRKHRKSWAEIAIRLGVTRQSAWERWRELDDEQLASALGAAARTEVALDVSPADDLPTPVAGVLGSVADQIVDEAAGRLRRRSLHVVPNVIGMSWENALHALREKGLVAVGSDPDGPPLSALGWPGGAVVDQSPEAGAKVPPGSRVTLWAERGGGSAGVREPRRPKPTPQTGRELQYESSDEAFG